MNILHEFRHPTLWYSKLIAALLALTFFTILAASIIAGYMVYRMVAPVGSETAIDLTNFPGHPEDMSYTLPSGEPRTGWFFPGLTSAPIVVLCPGYQTGRGESLPLAAAIQDHGYNVFVFDIEGPPGKRPYSTLGFREVSELRAAIAAVTRRDDIDRTRIGLWGTDMGGYAVLAVAESDPRIRAIAIGSVYDHPQDMARVLVNRQGVASLPLLGSFAREGFYWLHYSDRGTSPVSANLGNLAGVSKLFLAPDDDSALAASTQQLYRLAPEPKDIVVLGRGQYAGMVDDEKRGYENRLVSFLLMNLPAEAPVVEPAPASPATRSSKSK